MGIRKPLPQSAALLADSERIIPVMRWCINQGGALLQQSAGCSSRPSVLIDAPRSSKLIAQLMKNGAEQVGRTYGPNGEQTHWQAEIDGCRITWIDRG